MTSKDSPTLGINQLTANDGDELVVRTEEKLLVVNDSDIEAS